LGKSGREQVPDKLNDLSAFFLVSKRIKYKKWGHYRVLSCPTSAQIHFEMLKVTSDMITQGTAPIPIEKDAM
jgi:hypothetical protein